MRLKSINSENRIHEQHADEQERISNFATRDYPKCGAIKKSGGICNNSAGLRTEHFGEGRCYLHGGCCTGPKQSMIGNKRALKTGEYETINIDTLEDDELKLLNSGGASSAIALIEHEIGLGIVRENRMMKRIRELTQDEFTTEQIDVETTPNAGPKVRIVRNSSLQQIMKIEEALTRLQTTQAKYIELKHRLEEGNGQDDSSINDLVKVIEESRKMFGITA